MAARGGGVRRLLSIALLVGAASAALAAGGPDALVPFKDVAGAATEVSVAFVVDFGASGPPVVGCVQVPAGDDGYAALGAFVAQRGEAPPIYNSAGLLCSIDNLPGGAPGVCGAQVAGGYDYWSYWHGTTGSWVYATSGAFATVQNGDVEGWRYETDGQSSPNDPRPAAPPDYTAICGSAAPTSTTTPAAPSGSPAPSPPGSAPDGSVGGATAPVGPDASGGPSATPGGAPGSATSTTAAPSTPTPAGSGGRGTAAHRAAQSGAVPGAQSLSATSSADDRTGSPGSALPGVIGILVVLALAVAAVIGWRRRARTP